MSTKRSYLDNLNAGRQRRSGTSLDEISRTLEDIESRLERAARARAEREAETNDEADTDDIARRMEHLARQASRPARESAPRPALQKLARALDDTRRKEEELAFASRIAEELKTLRAEVGEMVSSGFRREFDSLREEIAQISNTAASPAAQRNAPSEAPGQRRDEPESRPDQAPRQSDPTLEGLAQRLERINEAVRSLPESLSLRSLEDKVRTLAAALEQVVEQQRLSPNLYSLINERLDEISRAIAASAPSAKAPTFDPEPFERIEARISSLAQQVAELVEEDRSAGLNAHLAKLVQRVDEIARRADLPDEGINRLARQLAAISEKLDTAFHAPDSEAIARGLDDRFAQLAEVIENSRDNTAEEGRSLFRELEARLNALSEKLTGREASNGADIMAAIDARFAELSARLEEGTREPADADALRALEARLEDISARLQNASAQISGLDAEVIAKLEAQVATLSEHLSDPRARLPELDDIGPRLEHIERTIAENREALFEAARRAAEEAINKLDVSQTGFSGAELAEELRALEALAHRSDERNTKTFEAIHDTLLKIVDRLAALEAGDEADYGPGADTEADIEEDETAVGAAPSIETDSAEDNAENDEETPNVRGAKRSPAEAAAAAAEAALSDEETHTAAAAGTRSVLGGLARALTARREYEEGTGERREPPMEAGEAEEEPTLKDINEPLEPGSGAPDLNAIMRRVRDERSSQPGTSEAVTAKSDFIAAARRAAQAAAAEAEIMKRKSADTGTTSRRFGLGQILRGRKKSALMAVAGFIVIAGGVYAARMVLTDDIPSVAKAPSGPTRNAVALANSPEATTDDSARTAAVDGEAVGTEETEPAESGGNAIEAAEADPRPAAAAGGEAANPQNESERGTAAKMPVSEESTAAPSPARAAESGHETAVGDIGASTAPEMAADNADKAADRQEKAETEEVTLADIPAEAGPVALREAAADGDPKAMFEIASRYAEGSGIERDMAKAAEWYRKAAELGLAPAQYRIGNMREKGLGVERDIDKARTWYERAAEQGNASAMHNLGVLYAMGADGEADNEKAVYWFQKAAELGVTDSQFNLGILSAKGVGVPQDLEEAYKWFALVAKEGDSDAAAKRDEIAKALTPEQLENARAKAELWKAKMLDRDANFVETPPQWTKDDTTTAGVDMEKAVSSIQLILNRNGYNAGPTDGVMGAKTRAAIKAFQKDNGMEPTGRVDKALVQALLEKK